MKIKYKEIFSHNKDINKTAYLKIQKYTKVIYNITISNIRTI